MATFVYAIERPQLPPFEMSDRFRREISYFISVPGENGIPTLPLGEYWISLADSRVWSEDGVLRVVSPLDSAHPAEVELSEEQQALVDWLVQHSVEHIRLS